jgi:hypothetical protein
MDDVDTALIAMIIEAAYRMPDGTALFVADTQPPVVPQDGDPGTTRLPE